MLGRELIDSGIESREGSYPGLGLLDVATRFTDYHKTTCQTTLMASHIDPVLSRMGQVKGYEIHMGETIRGGDRSAFVSEGAVSTDGLVFGTYLHGLFQNSSAVNALLSYLYGKKGMPFTPLPEGEADPYNECAHFFEEHVDMDRLLAIFKGADDPEPISSQERGSSGSAKR